MLTSVSYSTLSSIIQSAVASARAAASAQTGGTARRGRAWRAPQVSNGVKRQLLERAISQPASVHAPAEHEKSADRLEVDVRQLRRRLRGGGAADAILPRAEDVGEARRVWPKFAEFAERAASARRDAGGRRRQWRPG